MLYIGTTADLTAHLEGLAAEARRVAGSVKKDGSAEASRQLGRAEAYTAAAELIGHWALPEGDLGASEQPARPLAGPWPAATIGASDGGGHHG